MDNRISRKYNLRFSMNRTRVGRSIKLSTARKEKGKPAELFLPTGLVLDGIITEDELRRGLKAQFDFVLEDIVEHFKDQLAGATEEVERKREYSRARIAKKRLEEKTNS